MTVLGISGRVQRPPERTAAWRNPAASPDDTVGFQASQVRSRRAPARRPGPPAAPCHTDTIVFHFLKREWRTERDVRRAQPVEV